MQQQLSGHGSHILPAAPNAAWAALLDPGMLQAAIPGARSVHRTGPGRFRATISFGVGPISGRYLAELVITDQVPPSRLTLSGQSAGLFGGGAASASVALTALDSSRTRVEWRYQGVLSGPVALLGLRLNQLAADLFIQRLFASLARRLARVTDLKPPQPRTPSRALPISRPAAPPPSPSPLP